MNDILEKLKNMFNNKRCVLLGAGVSNMPLAKMLTELGASLEIRDKKTEDEMGGRADELKRLGADLVLGDGYLDGIGGDYIFRSPGFRPDLPALKEARESGSIITAEMDLFIKFAPCTVIGVTGSDGKSTTTTLISKIIDAEKKAGRHVFLGGNIGEPLLNRIKDMSVGDVACAELSSFQLMTVDSPVDVAVIKNITPNHLNWHTGMDEYIAAKARILKGCRRAVLNYDDETCRSLAKGCSAPITWFSRKEIPSDFLDLHEGGVYPKKDGRIVFYDSAVRKESTVMMRSDILLCGDHNVENYCTAIAAVKGLASNEAAVSVARSFGGVVHRLELVRELHGVRYYNSSIDSSPTRTAAAISAVDRPIRIICGGYDKKIPFEPLAEALIANGNIKTVVLTGATGEQIGDTLKSHPRFASSGIKLEYRPDFYDAVMCASNSAESGDAVLLSPACASFDAFSNFEERGNCFKKIVNDLK